MIRGEDKLNFKSFFSEQKAQISAEMLLVLAAVLAVAILLLNNLQSTAKDSSKLVEDNSDEAVDTIKDLD